MMGYARKKSKIIRDEFSLKKLSKKMMSLEEFAYDTETSTLRVLSDNDEFKLVGISISWGKYNNYYIPVGHVFDENQLDLDVAVRYLKPIFERKNIRLIGWNIKYDNHVLARVGINVYAEDLFDGMIASWLCDENTPKGLKENTERLFGFKMATFDESVATVSKEEKKSVGLKANNKATMDLVRIAVAAPYAMDDAYYTWECYLYYLSKLEEEKMDNIYYKVYPKFIKTLFDMEERGIAVYIERLKQMGEAMQIDIDSLEYSLYELAGVEFNANSDQQLAELLFGFEGTKHLKTDKKTGRQVPVYKNPNYYLLDNNFGFKVINSTPAGAPQTSGATLSILAKQDVTCLLNAKTKRKKEGVELCKKLLEYKKLTKLKTAFVDGVFELLYSDGKIHASCNIIGTTSGRISMSEPNLQQLPKSLEDDESGLFELVKMYKIRDMFIGSVNPKTNKRNKIIALDYKNLEMMLLAHFSKDKELIDTFAQGGDIHNATAKKMFNLECETKDVKKIYPILRQVAKAINFGLMYGMGHFKLYETLKSYGVNLAEKEYLDKYGVKKGEEVAQKYIDIYFETYKGVANFIRNQKKFAHRAGCVYTLVGRKRRLHNINSNDFKTVSYEERLSVNQPIQGSAGDVVIHAQLRIQEDKELSKLGCSMLIQVHDELVFECPEENVEKAISIITRYMEHPFGDNVELEIKLKASSGFGDSYQEAK